MKTPRLALLPLALLLSACSLPSALTGTATQVRAVSAPLPPACAAPAPRLAPPSGTLLGTDLDWSVDSPAQYAERSGLRPAVYSVFAPYALDRDARALVERAVTEVAEVRGALVLTLEPHEGLDQVTDATAAGVAELLAEVNERGVPVYLRFAQEMNGSWYPWGQRPQEFVRAWRVLAEQVHAQAPLTAMLWAPNYGVGYPFRDARQEYDKSNPATAQLDTDRDGRLTRADDPYAPFWPGDEHVDWVGMSLFHWGDAYPWDRQTLPEEGKFLAQLRGTYGGASGSTRTVPDFVRTYSVSRGKPFAVTETAARYSPPVDERSAPAGPSELAMKTAWIEQLTDPAVAQAVPTLAMLVWLEWDRHEVETRGRVDWRATGRPELARAWHDAVPSTWRRAGDLGVCAPSA